MTQAITLNLSEGSVRFNFSAAAAQDLQTALTHLRSQWQGPATTGQRQSLEYQHTGDVFLEIFCNPNIWPNAFAAKALITLRDDRIRLTTEASLSQLQEDLSQYLG